MPAMSRTVLPRRRFTGIATFALLLGVAASRVSLGGEARPTLQVPEVDQELEVALDLPAEAELPGSPPYRLAEVGRDDVAVPIQVACGPCSSNAPAEGERGQARLIAVIPPGGGESPRRFALRPAEGGPAPAAFRLEAVDDKSLGLWEGDAPVLVYNHGTITAEHVPENDRRRRRSCYIHPLYGLNGEVLTEDFPRDHYHHHGVFWTWPHVAIDGREYDLWADRGIKQRFVAWLCRDVGPLAGVIGVENGWFVGDRKVMIERVWITAHTAKGETRSVDLEFTWIPVDRPITLWGAGGKSYGGLTVRFAPLARKDPSTTITVPGGPTTGDLPDTPLAWADFTSQFGDSPTPSGAAVFVPPSHPDYPPTWLTRHYGPLCVGWPGVKPETFEPGGPIRLSYRIWIHKTPRDTSAIQAAYEAYAARVRWE